MSSLKQIIIIIFCSTYTIVVAQKIENKNPKKAAIYSAIIPGTGQIYTEKYWKTPIIYAGLITSAYYIKKNNESYQLYKNTYLDRINKNNSNYSYPEYSNSDLRTLTDYYRRNREISILCFFGSYILNIIDASVSAHLFHYDISDNLSLHLQPIYLSSEKSTGLSLCFNL